MRKAQYEEMSVVLATYMKEAQTGERRGMKNGPKKERNTSR